MSALFEEWQIGSMKMRNRIVRAATAESLCTREGVPSKRLVDLYQALGEGGCGAVITGYAYVSEEGRPSERAMNLGADLDEVPFRELVHAVQGEGARIIAQLVHGGSKRDASAAGPADVDPSAVAASFGSAAARAKKLGFDGVEVHAAHGYLLSQFLDSRANARADAYGGTLENRARLAIECVKVIRSQVGPTFPVLVKLNSCDVYGDAAGEAGGMSEGDSMQVAAWLAEAGASCIDVSGDWHGVEREDITGEPFFGPYASRLAAKLGVPVIVTGGWRDIETIERYLSGTSIAGVGMARPLIREAYLPARWEAGDLRPSMCTSCDFCTRYGGIPCIENRLSR